MHQPSNDDGEIYLAAVEGGGTTFVVSVGRVVKHHHHHHHPHDHGAATDTEEAADSHDNHTHNETNTTLLQIGQDTIEILHTATFPPKDAISGIIPTWSPTQILDAVCGFLMEHRPPPPPPPPQLSVSAINTGDKVSTTGQYSAVGIATFGPAGVHPHKPNYGTILNGSPKKEWRNVDILTPIRKACGMESSSSSRVRFDTDVNAPALAEFRHRCYLQEQQQQQPKQEHHLHNNEPSHHNSTAQPTTSTTPLTSLAYITIGTGVGVGLIINSQPVHGLLHPEGGHVAICPLDQKDDTSSFAGYSWGKERSPYGGVNTVEGVASSVALTERYMQMSSKEGNEEAHQKHEKAEDDDATTGHHLDSNSNVENTSIHRSSSTTNAQTREVLSTLPDSHPIWSHAANAIANLCVSLLLLNSIQKIVLGGGIMKRYALYPMIRQRVWTILNGYLDCVEELSDVQKLESVIVEGCWVQTNNLGSGLVGAYALALDAYDDRQS